MTRFRAAAAAVYDHVRLGPITKGARRGLLYLILLGVVVNAATIILAARGVTGARRVSEENVTRLVAQCRFYGDVGSAPVAVDPATGKVALLAVTIVADARLAWRGLGCRGGQPPPSRSFVKWAAYWDLHA